MIEGLERSSGGTHGAVAISKSCFFFWMENVEAGGNCTAFLAAAALGYPLSCVVGTWVSGLKTTWRYI